MPSRKDGRIEKGQKIATAISARAWNRAQDAADIVIGDRYSVTGGATSPVSHSYTSALVRNLSGRNCAIGDVLAIDNYVQLSSTYDYDPGGELLLHGLVASPSNLNTPFGVGCIGVAVEPVENGSIGRFAIDGIVLANVDTTEINSGGTATAPSSYPSPITKIGITSGYKSKHLALNSNGILCPSEQGPAILLGVPLNANRMHDAPASQPELCVIKIGHLPPTCVRFGVFNSGQWNIGETHSLFDIDRSGSYVNNGLRFIAWNNYRTITSGPSLVCCALDAWSEWQVVSVAHNPEITEVVVDVQVDNQGRVTNVIKKNLL